MMRTMPNIIAGGTNQIQFVNEMSTHSLGKNKTVNFSLHSEKKLIEGLPT